MNNFSGKRLIKWGLILSVVCFISIFLFTFRKENDLLNLLAIPTNRKIILLVVFLIISLFLGFILAGVCLTTGWLRFKFKKNFLYKSIFIGLTWTGIDLLLLNSGKFMLVTVLIDFILRTAIALMFFSQKDVKHK